MEGLVSLITSDGHTYTVLADVIKRFSVTLRNVIEDGADLQEGIPLPNISDKHLESIFAYCNHHFKQPPTPNKGAPNQEVVDEYAYVEVLISDWDSQWCKSNFYMDAETVDYDAALALTAAANYLDIEDVVKLIRAELQRYAITADGPQKLYDECNLQPSDYYDEKKNKEPCEQVWEVAPRLKGN